MLMALALVALVAFLITAPNHALAFIYVTSQSPQLQTFDDTTAPYSPVQIQSLSTTPNHGIAFDGSRWYVAQTVSSTFHIYDASFGLLGSVTVAGVADMRGLTYDSTSGHLFVADLNNISAAGIVREVTTDGLVLHQWSVGQQVNGIAWDNRSDTLWLAYYDSGTIENRTKTGALIQSVTFSGGRK